jgi:hypothetical protein
MNKIRLYFYSAAMVLAASMSVFSQDTLTELQSRVIKLLSENGNLSYRSKQSDDQPALFKSYESIKITDVKFDGCKLSYKNILTSKQDTSVLRPQDPSAPIRPPSFSTATMRNEISLDLSNMGVVKIEPLSSAYPSSFRAVILGSADGKDAVTKIMGDDKKVMRFPLLAILVKKDGAEEIKTTFEKMIALCSKGN